MKYLTTREVAEITGFCEETIRRQACLYARDKRSRRTHPRGLRGSQPNGRSWRFTPLAVRQFMEH